MPSCERIIIFIDIIVFAFTYRITDAHATFVFLLTPPSLA